MHGTWESFVLHATHASFTIPIPLTVSPQFASEHGTSRPPSLRHTSRSLLCVVHAVSVSWRIAVEFCVASQACGSLSIQSHTSGSRADTITASAGAASVEVLRWSAPITLLPSNPAALPATASFAVELS